MKNSVWRRARLLFLCAAGFLFAVGFHGCADEGVSGKTYYVDAEQGDDASDGLTEQGALRTLARVNELSLGAGDRLLFRSGQTFSGQLLFKGQGSDRHPIVVDRYGEGELPVIDGSGNEAAVVLTNQGNITLQNLAVVNTGQEEAKRSGIVINVSVWEGEGMGAIRNIALKNLDIHDIRGLSSRADGAMYGNSAIMVNKGNNNDPQSYLDGFLVENCHIHDITTSGMIFNSWPGTPVESYHKNVVVRNNVVERTGADGLVVGMADTPLLEGNKVLHAGQNGVGFQYIAALWTFHCHNSVVQYNEVAYTCADGGFPGDSQAFDTDNNSTGDHLYQYNYTHDNVGGILLTMGKQENASVGKIIYRYNISENDGRFNCNGNSTFAINNDEHYICNNTFYNDTAQGFQIKEAAEGDENRFYNNLFYLTGPVGLNPAPTGNLFENNLYAGGAETSRPDGDAGVPAADPLLASPGGAGDGREAAGKSYRPADGSPASGAGRKDFLSASDLDPKIRKFFTDTDYLGNRIDASAPPIGAIAP